MRRINNPQSFRANIRAELVKKFADEKLCANLEKGFLNYAIQEAGKRNVVKKWGNSYFVMLYIDRMRTVLMNLARNESLRKRLLSKSIRAHEVVFMSHQDIQPEKWNALLEAKRIRDESKYAPKLEANTDNFTCGKCKSKRCSYYQLQTRSADEPMTTFVTCIECGNRWKC